MFSASTEWKACLRRRGFRRYRCCCCTRATRSGTCAPPAFPQDIQHRTVRRARVFDRGFRSPTDDPIRVLRLRIGLCGRSGRTRKGREIGVTGESVTDGVIFCLSGGARQRQWVKMIGVGVNNATQENNEKNKNKNTIIKKLCGSFASFVIE